MNNKKEEYNEDIKRIYNYKKYNFHFWCSLFVLIFIIVFGIINIIMANSNWYFRIFKSTKIKEIDGRNYIGIVEEAKNRWHPAKIVTYYEEYNTFAYHKTEEYIQEYYSNDAPSIPKYREYYKIPKTDSTIHYYDEYGNVTDIKTYNEDGAIVNK